MANHQLQEALAAVWQIPRPRPGNLCATPAFVSLSEQCSVLFGCGKSTHGLSNALSSLGLPCELPANQADLALDLSTAADALQQTFTRKKALRRYLCPLDLAEKLPPLTFGSSRVEQFSPAELKNLFDAPKLSRNFPTLSLEAERLFMFHWLVVEEEIELDPRPSVRANPIFPIYVSKDLGEFDPLHGRFPPAVESAVFFLLLAPWEDWSRWPEWDWRGFRIPWIYTVDADLFVWPERPPSADSLSLEPVLVTDQCGKQFELERPTTLPLEDRAVTELQAFTNTKWTKLQDALSTPLFETPVVHFLVRAFLADGMDEVMAHMTVIEAAFGLEADYRGKLRQKPDPHKKVYPADRVAMRLGAALDDAKAIKDYRDLFNLRSAFVHGRAGLQKISTQQRVLARSLARRAVRALVIQALKSPRSRDELMAELLDKGIALRSA